MSNDNKLYSTRETRHRIENADADAQGLGESNEAQSSVKPKAPVLQEMHQHLEFAIVLPT